MIPRAALEREDHMRRQFRMAACAALLLRFTVAVDLSAQDVDPIIGTWILNVDRSTYEGVQAPTSEVRTFDYHGDGNILYTRQSVNSRGNRSSGHFLVTLDGQ